VCRHVNDIIYDIIHDNYDIIKDLKYVSCMISCMLSCMILYKKNMISCIISIFSLFCASRILSQRYDIIYDIILSYMLSKFFKGSSLSCAIFVMISVT
jgi:hypothetical protein